MARASSIIPETSYFLSKQHTMSHYTHIINGKPASSSSTLDVQNPATQKKIAEVPVATKDQLDEAVAAARAALPAWSAKSQDERAQVLEQIAGIIQKNISEYKYILVLEQGKTLNDAEMEIGAAVVMLLETAKLRVPEKVIIDNEQVRITERRVPIGVCAGIAPCGQYLRPQTLSFYSSHHSQAHEGYPKVVPPGVINVLSGDDNLGPWITAHPGIDKVSFTGSSDTGKRVMASASIGLKRLTLELGGNDPAIILPDVDVAKIVPEIFWAALINNGQTCVADCQDRRWHRPESQLGPVQNLMQYKKVLSFFEDAKANGYKFVTGGDVNPNPTDGLFIPASFVITLRGLEDCARGAIRTHRTLLKWSDEADVIKRANDTNMGLAASVWGKDLAAVQRIAKQIEAGVVCMNERNPVTPFSVLLRGHKESGIGVENGLSGLLSYSNIQTLTLKKQPAFV
ncbi:aldehyde dehydrogenase family [Rhizoctonia solani]|uniref:Aldehyde dehydrogenase family n=1 Tax=Rhizoctonia solani TaxID=456999 RepID=A0A8H7I527_9AGAM|nr:aldehyde dehydrogenase family [Rhizoctonia solani]